MPRCHSTPYDRPNSHSEPVGEPGRDPHRVAAAPGGRTRAAVVDERSVRGIVTVGLDAVTAGADVVVSIAAVDGLRPIEVPRHLLVELMPVLSGVHVGVVVGGLRIVVVLP